MSSEQINLTRRTMLKGALASWIAIKLPALNADSALLSELSTWSEEMRQAFPLVDTICNLYDKIKLFQSLDYITKPIADEGVPESALHSLVGADFGEFRPAEYWNFSRRLSLAWSVNIPRATENIRALRELQQVIELRGTPLKRVFELLEDKNNRNNFARARFAKDYGIKVNGDWDFKDIVDEGRRSQFRLQGLLMQMRTNKPYMHSLFVSKPQDLAQYIHKDIFHALNLPLEDGCLDLLVSRGNLANFQFLLDHVPEVIPPEKIAQFRWLSYDLSRNGRQTISIEHFQRAGDALCKREYFMHIEQVNYRWGFTDLQNFRSQAYCNMRAGKLMLLSK